MTHEERRTEIIGHLNGIRDGFLSAIEGLTEEQCTERTIDGWSVKDHLMHLAFWHDLRASEIVRISAGYEHAWPLSVESDPLNDLVQSARADLSLEQAHWEYNSALDRAVSAVKEASERGLTDSHYGEVGLRTTHDLAHAGFITAWRERRGI